MAQQAEANPLKGFQCRFESDRGYQLDPPVNRKSSDMPMIDVYARAGTFSDKHKLAADLAKARHSSGFRPQRVGARFEVAPFRHAGGAAGRELVLLARCGHIT